MIRGIRLAKKLPTVWDLQPHTKAKHVLLQNYLQAWFRIMTLGYNSSNKAIYIDGFSGPGVYSNSEDGSPVLALKESIEYSNQSTNKPNLRFIFIEEDNERFINLQKMIAYLFDEPDFQKLNRLYKPEEHPNFSILTINGSFESVMDKLLTKMQGNMAPSFSFIDPFGYKTMPYDIIKRLLVNDRSEVFINFMYEDINRFLKKPALQSTFNRLFGTEKWKEIVNNLPDYSPSERRYFLHKLYKEQLEEAGLKYVISFEMKNENNATEYFLYYGTNHIKGLEKMKDAMWKVDRSGGYTFSDYDAKNPQLSFVEFDRPDLSILAKEIHNRFNNKVVLSERVRDFVIVHTLFRKSVHSTEALKMLEATGKITSVTNRKKKNSYPDGSIITFSP